MEAIHRDYADKGVRFYYIYKALAHPEKDGYVQPVTLEERLLHAQEAKRNLGTQIEWLVDSIENDAKHALGNAPNSEFLIGPDGRIVAKRRWSDPRQLRAELAELLGEVDPPTRPGDLDLKLTPPSRVAATGIVQRLELPQGLQPVKAIPTGSSDGPHYVKLRAEMDSELLRNGKGQMYLAFHLDPIYHVHWNNLVEPVKFRLKASPGELLDPASGEGPKVEVASDADPREFLIEVSSDKLQPLELTVEYFACNDEEGWCKPVEQSYLIFFERDQDAGRVMRRSGRGPRAGRRPVATAGATRTFFSRKQLESLDRDNDGILAYRELPSRMAGLILSKLDRNEDQEVSSEEIADYYSEE